MTDVMTVTIGIRVVWRRSAGVWVVMKHFNSKNDSFSIFLFSEILNLCDIVFLINSMNLLT